MTSEKAVTKTFRLSDTLSVEMTVGPGGFSCEWDPEVPDQLTQQELDAYLKAREEMLLQLVEIIGGSIAVADVEEDGNLSIRLLGEKD